LDTDESAANGQPLTAETHDEIRGRQIAPALFCAGTPCGSAGQNGAAICATGNPSHVGRPLCMKMKLTIVLLSFCLAVLAACSKSKPEAAPAPAASGSAAPTAAGVHAIAIEANDTMKYNLTRIEVTAGEEVSVTLTNAGTQPKLAMGHNWILLKKDADPVAFASAAITAQAQDYFPSAQMGQVLVHTKLLGPKESDTVTFKAPTEPGEYPFLCSFPGHFQVGMKGVLVVR
jgi:azurin